MKWWLVKPSDYIVGALSVTPMWISDPALVIKEADWRATPNVAPWTKQEIASITLDCGGMISSESHRFARQDFFGTELLIYAIHVDVFIAELEALELRPSGLYNVPSWPALLVLTPEQRDAALVWLRSIRAEANAISDVENRAFNERMLKLHNVAVRPRPVGKMEDA